MEFILVFESDQISKQTCLLRLGLDIKLKVRTSTSLLCLQILEHNAVCKQLSKSTIRSFPFLFSGFTLLINLRKQLPYLVESFKPSFLHCPFFKRLMILQLWQAE